MEAEQHKFHRQEINHREIEKSRKLKDKTDLEFEKIKKIGLAHQLHQAFGSEKHSLQLEMDRRDRIVKGFVDKMRARDREYMDAIERFSKDTSKNVDLIDDQYITLRNSYKEQLENFDIYMNEEYKKKRIAFANGLGHMIKEEKDKEKIEHGKRINEDHHGFEKIEALIFDKMYIYSQSKVDIEEKIQKLQMYMEMNKSKIRLNQETIEYNVAVLNGRKDDNDDLREHQGKKLRTLERRVREASEQVEKDLRNYQDKNKKLTDDLQKLTSSYKALQVKLKHFCKVDKNKYTDVWAMHEDAVKELLTSIYNADHTIHQQQLDQPWQQPEDPLQQNFAKDQTKEGIEEKVMEIDKNNQTLVERLLEREGEYFTQNLIQLLELLEHEARWLLDEETQNNDNRLVRFSAILRNLKVTKTESLQKIMLHFFVKGKTDLQSAIHRLDYDADQIMQLLAKWSDTESTYIDEEASSDTKSQYTTNTKTTKKTKTSNKKHDHNPNRQQDDPRQRREDFERNFWENLKIPDEKVRVWTALDGSLKKYYHLLQGRQKLVEDTGKLHLQNEELKTLLKQYLQANINLDLIVPPTDVIRYDEEDL